MNQPVARSPEAVELRRRHRANFDVLNAELAVAHTDRWVRFFNMGYRDIGDTSAAAQLNADSVRLIREVIGDTDLADQVVCEVGCGRGGNLSHVQRHHSPRAVVGVDLVESTLRGARRANRSNRADRTARGLVVGTAEELPLKAACCDVVLNVESSQFYPSVSAFYFEAHRVLRSGGRLLYADLMLSELLDPALEVLGQVGFRVDRVRDISANVLASRRAVGAQQARAYADSARGPAIENFVGAADTASFAVLASGRATYRIVHATAAAPAASLDRIEASAAARALRRASAELFDLTGDLTRRDPSGGDLAAGDLAAGGHAAGDLDADRRGMS